MQSLDQEIAALTRRAEELAEKGDHDAARSIYEDALRRMKPDDPRYEEIAAIVRRASLPQPQTTKRGSARVYLKSPLPLWKRPPVRWAALAIVVLLEIGMLFWRNAQLEGLAGTGIPGPRMEANAIQPIPPLSDTAPLPVASPTPRLQSTPAGSLLPFEVTITAAPSAHVSPMTPTPTRAFTSTPSPAALGTPTATPSIRVNGPLPTGTAVRTPVPAAPTPAPTTPNQPISIPPSPPATSTSAPPPTSSPIPPPSAPKPGNGPKPGKGPKQPPWNNAGH